MTYCTISQTAIRLHIFTKLGEIIYTNERTSNLFW